MAQILSIILVVALAYITVSSRTMAAEQLYDLDLALRKGAVDLASLHPRSETGDIINHLKVIQPGIVNRFGYFWGGPSERRMADAQSIIVEIRKTLPHALLGGALSESISGKYNELIFCNENGKARQFRLEELTSGVVQQKDAIFVDLSKDAAVEFYRCVGKRYIDMGFNIIHFESPASVIRHAGSPDAAMSSYIMIIQELREYARYRGRPLYLSGDLFLSRNARLELLYIPSRVYHNTVPDYMPFRRKILNPGVGVGYTYALSEEIVRFYANALGGNTKVMFYVDNWDRNQDDLRRFMELDAANRRKFIQLSYATARKYGSFFVVPLNHCTGCVEAAFVGDQCEIVDSNMTEYNAVRCNDVEFIAETFHGRE